MTKAYDRVAWPFLYQMMRKLEFSEQWVELIHRHISCNWYSIIVNGQRHGFFKSWNGLREGDPISPSLFVISVELQSILLNKPHENRKFTGFSMNKRGPQINHLAFADNAILFSSGRKRTIKLVMNTLAVYKDIFGQLLNKTKSYFLLTPDALGRKGIRLARWTGMKQQKFPIKYLGCPLFVGRQKIVYY